MACSVNPAPPRELPISRRPSCTASLAPGRQHALCCGSHITTTTVPAKGQICPRSPQTMQLFTNTCPPTRGKTCPNQEPCQHTAKGHPGSTLLPHSLFPLPHLGPLEGHVYGGEEGDGQEHVEEDVVGVDPGDAFEVADLQEGGSGCGEVWRGVRRGDEKVGPGGAIKCQGRPAGIQRPGESLASHKC